MSNPSAVIQAFFPEEEYELTLEAVLLLEAIGCKYLTGGVPGMRDAILCYLAITDFKGLKKARHLGKLDATIEAWSQNRRPSDILAMQPMLTKIIASAFAPADDGSGGEDGDDSEDDDPVAALSKKAAAAVDGGFA